LRAKAGEHAAGEFDRAEIDPEDPVEKGLVVVAFLTVVLVPDRELVGDVEQVGLVFASKFSADQGPTLLKDPNQCDGGGAFVVLSGFAGPEHGHGMGDTLGNSLVR